MSKVNMKICDRSQTSTTISALILCTRSVALSQALSFAEEDAIINSHVMSTLIVSAGSHSIIRSDSVISITPNPSVKFVCHKQFRY